VQGGLHATEMVMIILLLFVAAFASLAGDGHEETSEIYSRFLSISRDLLGVEREKIISLRDEGSISDEVLRRLETELDLNETRLLLAASGQADD